MSYENKIRFSMLCCTFVCTCVSVCGDNICELSDVSRRLWGLSYAHIHQSGHRASCGLVLQWFHLDAGGENVGSVLESIQLADDKMGQETYIEGRNRSNGYCFDLNHVSNQLTSQQPR